MSKMIRGDIKTHPENNKFVLVTLSDCRGEYEIIAKKLSYKLPPKGISKNQAKGYRKGFRWIGKNNEPLFDQAVLSWRNLPSEDKECPQATK